MDRLWTQARARALSLSHWGSLGLGLGRWAGGLHGRAFGQRFGFGTLRPKPSPYQLGGLEPIPDLGGPWIFFTLLVPLPSDFFATWFTVTRDKRPIDALTNEDRSPRWKSTFRLVVKFR